MHNSRRVLLCLLFTFLWLFYHSSRISLRFFAGIKVARGWEMLKLLVNVGIRVTARKTLQRRISSNEPQRFSRFSDHTVQPFEIFSQSLFAFLSCLYSAYLSKLSRHIVPFTVFQVFSASQWRRVLRTLLFVLEEQIKCAMCSIVVRWKLRDVFIYQETINCLRFLFVF